VVLFYLTENCVAFPVNSVSRI